MIDWSSKDLEHFYRLLIVFIIFVVAVIVGYFLLALLVAIVRHNHEIKYYSNYNLTVDSLNGFSVTQECWVEDTTSHTLTIQTTDGIVTMTAAARLVITNFLLRMLLK